MVVYVCSFSLLLGHRQHMPYPILTPLARPNCPLHQSSHQQQKRSGCWQPCCAVLCCAVLCCAVLCCAKGDVTEKAIARMSCTQENAKWVSHVILPQAKLLALFVVGQAGGIY